MIRRTQEADGSWYGRWGVNYIYGTWQVLRGIAAIGENMNQEWIRRGFDWLESCQNDDGGWGETCESYNFPALKGRGPSTASQTSWAVMGLCACGDPNRDSIRRGIQFLLRTQNEDGSWTEDSHHRHRLSLRFLPKIRYVSPAFPSARAGDLSENALISCAATLREIFRFPSKSLLAHDIQSDLASPAGALPRANSASD